ncbi:MAG: hypothetical protein ACLVKI_05665 [Gordonibacter urolithinfaciens]
MKRIVVLGSTGSIGTQTLDVARRHADKLEVVALAAGTRAEELLAQAREFGCTTWAWRRAPGGRAGGRQLPRRRAAALPADARRRWPGRGAAARRRGSLGFGAQAVADRAAAGGRHR